MKTRNTAIIGMMGVALFVFSVILSGFQFASYSHIAQFISEASAQGTPYGFYFRLFGYAPSGVLFIVFGVRVLQHFHYTKTIQIACAGFYFIYGIGIIITSVFPCDQGCPTTLFNSSFSQILHNIFSVLVYVFVPLCLLIMALLLRRQHKRGGERGVLLGVLTLTFVPLVLLLPNGPYVGLFQRIIEGGILVWILLTCFNLWSVQTAH